MKSLTGPPEHTFITETVYESESFFSAAIGTAALVAGGVHALAQQDHSGHGAAGI